MSQIVYKKASFVKRSFKAKRVLYYWSLLPFHPFRGQTYCFRQNCQSYPRHGGWRRSRMIHFHQHSLFFVAFFSAASIAVWRNGIGVVDVASKFLRSRRHSSCRRRRSRRQRIAETFGNPRSGDQYYKTFLCRN